MSAGQKQTSQQKVSSFSGAGGPIDGDGEGSAPDSLGPSITADVRWYKKKKNRAGHARGSDSLITPRPAAAALSN